MNQRFSRSIFLHSKAAVIFESLSLTHYNINYVNFLYEDKIMQAEESVVSRNKERIFN